MSTMTKVQFGLAVAAAGFVLACPATQAAQPAPAAGAPASQQTQAAKTYGFGTNITQEDVARFTSSIPTGADLPEGSGTVLQGKAVYTAQCMACHGADLQGGIGDRLIGGRGTLAYKANEGAPIKTIESYWPYATTVFDYIKRAMPFTAPGSLSDDDVYAVTAYILSEANIIKQDEVMDAKTLPKVVMPNHDGFQPAGR